MRLKTLLAGLLVLLLLPGAALAINGIEPIPVFPTPTAFGGNFVRMGWYNCNQAWFTCRETNNIRYTGGSTALSEFQLTLSPKLSSALVPRELGGEIAARPLYLVTNFQNPPVFSTAPGQPDYSALWQVFEITWKPGVPRRAICNADPASPENPCGLPGPSEADITATDVVLDCPILVLGPLTWPKSTGGSNYIIPQAVLVDPKLKLVFLPGWLVYCQDPVSRRVDEAFALITEASDPALAKALGANLAPGLLNMPDEDTTDFYVMRGPKPLTQLPLVRDCLAEFTPFAPYFVGFNINAGYSPVMRYVILQRNVPPNCLIKTIDSLDLLLGTGGLIILKDDQRINAPIIIAS